MAFESKLGGVRGDLIDQWEKAPVVLRASEGAPAMPVERVWSLVAGGGQARREGGAKALSMRFWVDRTEPVKIEEYLPGREHPTVGSYLEALKGRVGERDFTLVINGAQALSRELYLDLRTFLAPLTARVGLAVAETAIYLSRSRRTVFGVHCDESANFLFVAYGTKRFRLWPREVLDAHPHLKHSLEYGEIMGQSTLVELAAGDLLYMPAGCYHVAEAEGEVGMHFSLGIRIEPGLSRSMVEQAAARAVAKRLRTVPSVPFLAAETGQNAARLPPPLAEGSSALAGGFADEIERALVEQWAKFVSSGGFLVVPPTLPEAPLADAATLRLAGGFPLVFDVRGDDLLVAAHGHALQLPAHPAVVALLGRLNEGRPWRAGALIAEHAGEVVVDGVAYEADAEGLRSLLQSLVALGALEASG
ncbi:MAG TPA: cupin domain-containing protein [Polyangiaceae bacterium]|nr:cupin domain-containing protein [Polyangiaceae bacterium]